LGEIVAQMPIPSNLFVVGTVNMDETTYAFSPKVLDRANTVAFDEVDLGISDTWRDAQIDSGQLRDLGMALCDRPYRQLDDIRHREEVMAWNTSIEAINAILLEENLHFAYRIRDEMLRYMAYALDLIESLPTGAPLFTAQDAFDFQILQKVLPRLTGAGDEAGEVLDGLIAFCEGEYVRSAQKLGRMKRRLERTGFVSFW
jgi:5-methylcytosine-specific restriction protein B